MFPLIIKSMSHIPFFKKKKKRRDAYLRLLISSKANKFGREQTNVIIPGRIFESMLTKWSQ